MEEKKEYKELIIQGTIYKTTFTKKFEQRENYKAPDENLIYSFIPGTVIDIFVKPKEKVNKGDTIMLLEAMKMQNQIKMPFDGEIVKIHVKKDELIPNRHLMVAIKPSRPKIK